jgi:hypothetical protein
MRLAESLVQVKMAIESSLVYLLVYQPLESLFPLLCYTKENQETFKMVGCKICKLENKHTLVYQKMGGVMMHLGFNGFRRSFKSILDISDSDY